MLENWRGFRSKRMSHGLDHLAYRKGLKKLNFSLSKTRIKGDLITVCKYIQEEEISDIKWLINLAEKV